MNKIHAILFIATIVLSAYSLAKAQNVNIPDPNFKSYLIGSIINTNGDSEIQVSEAEAFSGALNVRYQEISDMTGIEAFTSLVELDCSDNSLSSLDVSSNIALTSLYCNRNQLSNLNVSANTTLQSLNCSSNQLTNLDVSSNTELTDLSCFSNQLSDLNVSNNTKLSSLVCSANPLGSLDVSLNTALLYLYCTQNQLSNLDVRANTALIHLYCSTNQLSSLDISLNTALTNLICGSNQLKNLNVNANTALMQLSCHTNQLSSLDVSANTALQGLHCYSNELASLDVSTNTALQGLYCSSNKLRSLDVSANTSLVVLFCDSNQLSSLNVKNGNNLSVTGFNALDNPNLSCISVNDVDSATVNWTNIDPGVSFNTDCGVYIPDANFKAYLVGNTDINTNGDDKIQVSEANSFNGTINVNNQNITDLTGIEAFVAVTELNCSSNNLASIDVSNNTALTSLVCYSNLLESIAVSNNTLLTALLCGNNSLSSLDITNNTLLETLWCSSNSLSSLDVSANTLLTSLLCENNSLSNLDVSNNTLLEELWCSSNSVGMLDVSNNMALSNIICNSNGMTMLNIGANPSLIHLDCSANSIGSLDVSNSTAIESLDCNKNSLTNLDLSTNTALTTLKCDYNSLASLDLRDNTALNYLNCGYNRLMILDVRNGNNSIFTTFEAANNPKLTCINVSDVVFATANWTNIDAGVSFNTDCPVYVPDTNFKTYLIGNSAININGDDEIQLSEAALFNGMIDVMSLGISDLTGIEAFPLINGLNCSSNFLNRLDVRHNANLAHLSCSDNPLEVLNISNGNNSNILTFEALNNPNLSCISVSDVNYATDNWTNIDPGVSFNTDCAVYIPDANFKAYLVSNADINTNGDGDIQFSEAEVFHGRIRAEELGITDMTGIEAFTAIKFLDCGRNALNDLDVSQNVALETLRCDGNTLTSLDVSANEALVDLYCRSNSISSLDVSNNLNLTDLNFGINLVSSIDVSANIALMKLTCNENSISSLDVSNNSALIYLFCDHNSISNLDVSNNTALTRLHCGQNPLGSLDVSNNIELISLSCSDNSLSSLDVSMNTALTSLSCSGNSLNSLNISANLNLHLLYCFNNAITELDLKNNTALGLLLCHDNALSNLDLRNGNNSEIFAFNATNNQDLSCISVSEVDYTTNNWTNIDPGVVFSSDCRYQEISFDALANKAYGDADFSLSATASSGLAVSYSSSNTLVATISGSAVTIVGAGSTTITAAQMGDSNYDAAIAVDQLFTVNKSSQTITFGPLADKIYGDADFTLNASASSGLAVSYSSSNTSVAIISGSTVTIVGAGSTTIAAAQIGDNNYDAAAVVEQMLVIKKANQIITFEELTDRNFEDGDLVLSATSSSGLPVSFTSSNTSVAIIAASNVDIIDAGITIITAFQSGDINYNKADDVSQELSIIITGIEDQISIIGFKLSPNPVKDYLYLECDNNKQIRSITIIDNAGKRVFRQYEYVNGSPINISGFKRGLYHLIAETDYLEIKEKFIIE